MRIEFESQNLSAVWMLQKQIHFTLNAHCCVSGDRALV